MDCRYCNGTGEFEGYEGTMVCSCVLEREEKEKKERYRNKLRNLPPADRDRAERIAAAIGRRYPSDFSKPLEMVLDAW